MERLSIIDFGITTGKYSSFVNHIVSLADEKRSANVCVANVHMFMEAHRDRRFKEILNDATVVTPDGKPLTWVLRYVYGIQQDRVAGMDLLPDLLQQMMLKKMPAFFYGGTPAMLEKNRALPEICLSLFAHCRYVQSAISPRYRRRRKPIGRADQ